MKTRYYALAAAACAAWTAPSLAQEAQIGPDRYAATVRTDMNPATPAAARRSLARIDAAALAACGVPSSSLREVVRAARGSDCWHEAMAGAMVGVDNPLLLQAYHRRD